MKQFVLDVQAWLNAHPKVKGALVLTEATAVSYVIGAIQSGNIVLTKDGLHSFLIGLVGAVYLALKNYWTLRPTSANDVQQQTPPAPLAKAASNSQ